MDNRAPAQIHMDPVTTTRTLAIPGYANSDGVLYADPLERRSGIFAGGGYEWSIGYCPNSLYIPDIETIDLRLQLESPGCRVTASFSARLLDPTGSLPPWELLHTPPEELQIEPDHNESLVITLSKTFLNTGPDPRYLTRGGLVIEFTITVFTAEKPAPPAAALSRAKAPASDMMQQLGEIYATGDGADVTFSVKGEIFRAHKVILAMRSPAFKAQLYGGGKMVGSAGQLIEVEDMEPDVFKALLCYIYTDTLPAKDEGNKVDEEDATEVISHLLVAADRYGVERLRILCEHRLCGMVDADSFVKMLVFAEEQHCAMLRDACIKFMATSDRMGEVVVRKEYVQLCSTHPMLLIDALEKSNKFR